MSDGKGWTRMCFADDVEKEVVNCAGFKERFRTLASQRYNASKPDQTMWWLFPRSRTKWGNWPAYSLGKYFFDRESGRGVMRAGLHMEKGLAPAHAKSFDSAKARYFAMTKDWAWFPFLGSLEDGRLAAALDEARSRSGLPVDVTLETSFALDELENHIHEVPGHHRFQTSAGGGLTVVEERVRPNKLLGVGKVSSLPELAARLRRCTEEEPWTWVNVFVSVGVPFFSEPPVGQGPAWTGSDFWRCILEPLAPWVE